jgi:hypothetical protein
MRLHLTCMWFRNLIYHLSLWSWVFEKWTVAQPLKKFPAFYGTRRFIAVFTRAHTTGIYPEPDKSSPYLHSISVKSTLILYSHLRLGLPGVLFPSCFPIETLHELLSHACYMRFPSQTSWLDRSNEYIWRRVQVTKLLMKFSSASHYHPSWVKILPLASCS